MDDELLLVRDPDGGLGRRVPNPGENLRLHHMAVVVKDLERAIRLFKALGYVEEATSFVDGVKNVVMTCSGGASMIVQSPVSRHSELVEHLAKHGAGVMHLGFEAENLKQAQEALAGLLVWEREPMVVPSGLLMLFSKPDPVTGLVFEILEQRPEAKVRPLRGTEKRKS